MKQVKLNNQGLYEGWLSGFTNGMPSQEGKEGEEEDNT
jgi:hypothetical protein